MNIDSTICGTPLIKINNYTENCGANIYLKCEFKNPLSSVKDRIGIAMIEDAETRGWLKPNTTVIEPTSGNTGIALAFLCAQRNYKCILTMPDTMSNERKALLSAFGASLILTDGALGMSGAIARANEIYEDNKREMWMPMQFENPANPLIHHKTTGPEIMTAMEGNLDAFVSGVGTGGTISGVSKYIKETGKDLHSVAVEPTESPVISQGEKGPHKIQGIGAGFVPINLDMSQVDEVITVSSEEAFDTAKGLAIRDGIPAGISTGANVKACLKLAESGKFDGKNIVTVGCSSMERYLTTAMFN